MTNRIEKTQAERVVDRAVAFVKTQGPEEAMATLRRQRAEGMATDEIAEAVAEATMLHLQGDALRTDEPDIGLAFPKTDLSVEVRDAVVRMLSDAFSCNTAAASVSGILEDHGMTFSATVAPFEIDDFVGFYVMAQFRKA